MSIVHRDQTVKGDTRFYHDNGLFRASSQKGQSRLWLTLGEYVARVLNWSQLFPSVTIKKEIFRLCIQYIGHQFSH
jgi:hypothetical protein